MNSSFYLYIRDGPSSISGQTYNVSGQPDIYAGYIGIKFKKKLKVIFLAILKYSLRVFSKVEFDMEKPDS